jgi:photosystem II stability/assembly factor-like uncharacterized protein
VYKPLLAAGLRMLTHLVSLYYLDNKALWPRNCSYTRALAGIKMMQIKNFRKYKNSYTMKINLQLLFLFLSISINLFSQKDWDLLNPTPTINTGVDIHFVTNEIGYIITNKEILKTTDAGENWTISQGISSANDLNFYNSSGFIVGNSGYVIKSTDNGNTWNSISAGTNDNFNSVNMINEDTILISSSNKLLSSYDGGSNWQSYNITGYSVNKTFFINSKVGHAACNSGKIIKTIDGGLNWYVTESVNTTPSDFFTIYFINSEVGFATREHNDILKTTNGGESWVENMNTSDAIYSFYFFDELNGYISGEYGVIFKTTDGGTSWEWVGFQSGRIDGTTIYAIHFIDNNIGFAVGLRGRILKTIDGGNSWVSYAPTYNDIKHLDFVSNDFTYALVGNTFFKSINRGYKWSNLGPPIENVKTQQFDFINDSTGFAIIGGSIGTSGNSGSVYKTIDGGISWNKTHSSYEILYEDLYCIDFVNQDTGFVSGGYNFDAIFRTINGGIDWEMVANISCGQIQFLNSKVGYARNVGNLYNRIYKTIDGGTTWTSTFEIDEDINCFHFIDEDHGYFVGDNSLMYKTTDGGDTWQELDIPYEYYEFVRFYTYNVGYILDEEGRLYKTENGGNTWERLDYYYGINSIEFSNDDIYLSGSWGKILKSQVEFDEFNFEMNPVVNFSDEEAQLTGIVASNGDKIDSIKFEYGLFYSFNNSINATPSIIAPNKVDSVFAGLNNLESNSEYYCRLVIQYGGTEYISNYETFTTLPEIEISINYVNSYSSNEVDLSGNIISYEDDVTDIEFQFGTDTLFSYSIDATPNIVSGGTNQDISCKLTQLEPETKYYARIKAIYKGVEKHSSIVFFTTQPDYEINLDNPYINNTNVTLRAYISAFKDTIDNIVFEYDKTRDYSSNVEASPNQIIKNTSGFIEAQLTDLDANSFYFYRLKANLGSETIYSNENILQFKSSVIIVPIEVQEISDSSILLQGLINTNGNYIYGIQFEYGISENFGDSIYTYPHYIYDRQTHTVQSTLDSLLPQTKYYFRIKATDGENIYYSDIFSYTLGETNGLDRNNGFSNINIFPNPTNDYFIVKSSEHIEKIELMDSNGKLLFIRKNEEFFNLSGYPTGLYYIRIYTNEKLIIRKIIKN